MKYTHTLQGVRLRSSLLTPKPFIDDGAETRGSGWHAGSAVTCAPEGEQTTPR